MNMLDPLVVTERVRLKKDHTREPKKSITLGILKNRFSVGILKNRFSPGILKKDYTQDSKMF